jgi:hypothetical protein
MFCRPGRDPPWRTNVNPLSLEIAATHRQAAVWPSPLIEKEHPMRRYATVIAAAALMTLSGASLTLGRSSAQEVTPTTDLAAHPLVGAWMFDTDLASQADPPELGLFTSDGIFIGLGSSESAGSWTASDPQTGALTLISRFDDDGGGYAVIRGPHVVDATGDRWTCDCTYTIVAADGTVLDAGRSSSEGVRIPVEPAEAMGTPLAGAPLWGAAPASTPTS